MFALDSLDVRFGRDELLLPLRDFRPDRLGVSKSFRWNIGYFGRRWQS